MNFDKNPNPGKKMGVEGGMGGSGGGEDMNIRAAIFYIQDTLSQPLLQNRVLS